MKHSLLMTTLLAGVMAAGSVFAQTAETVNTLNPAAGNAQAPAAADTGTQTTAGATARAQVEQRYAAESMIEHVNLARLALALKNKEEAAQHIQSAKSLAATLAGTENQIRKRVQSGRFTYEYGDNTQEHYFPIAGGMIERKEFDTGPFWAEREGVAVKNAEVAYVSIAVDTKAATEKLNQAETALKDDNVNQASRALDDLVNTTVTAEKTEELPLVKAQDNLALAKGFLRAKNYAGARFALGHAEDAMEAMTSDQRYTQHDQRIQAIQSEVQQMQATLDKNDPSLLDKAEAKMNTWWEELKSWSDKKTSNDTM